jgi:VanZ family protein
MQIAELHSFNLIPFYAQMASVQGFVSILEGVWPFAALAFISMSAMKKSSSFFAVRAGLLLGVLVFVLEWCQQFIPGRYPDITQVILAAAGWAVPWLIQARDGSTLRAVPPGSEIQDV